MKTLHHYNTQNEMTLDFLIGIAILIALNLLLWVLYLATNNTFFVLIPWPLNIGLMIYFGMTRYWIALGMLGGLGLAFIITTVLLATACFAVIYMAGHH